MSVSAEFYATLTLDKVKIKNVPVNPNEVAKKLDIAIKEVNAYNNFDGYLLKCNGCFGIVINSAIKNVPRKDFTIAHEIGHAEIPHHVDDMYKCLKSDIGFSLLHRQQEREANEFAASLLMPTAFVTDEIKRCDIGFEVIRNISEKCGTSLISSGIRYMQHCEQLAAIVVSERRKIKYFFLSEMMRDEKISYLSSDMPLTKGAIAYNFFESDGMILTNGEESRKVSLSVWFPSLDYGRYDCHEHCIATSKYNQTISLVWLIEKYDDDFLL